MNVIQFESNFQAVKRMSDAEDDVNSPGSKRSKKGEGNTRGAKGTNAGGEV